MGFLATSSQIALSSHLQDMMMLGKFSSWYPMVSALHPVYGST